MKNKKLSLTQFSLKAKSLSEREQKEIKGGNQFSGHTLDPIVRKWIEVDIRGTNPEGQGPFKGKSLRPIRRG